MHRFHAISLAVSLTALSTTLSAWALSGDRLQPIVVEADRPGSLDLQRQVVVFNGKVQIQQGTLRIEADRVEVRELPGGARAAIATGSPARYRQQRDVAGEWVEGSADRIEYDSQAGTLRLIGNGAVRRLRDGKAADEITGALITWDDRAELFSVEGSATAVGTPGGRVRAVLTPRGPQSPASGTAR
jgi:lipopolysaccharide export system protein LptA